MWSSDSGPDFAAGGAAITTASSSACSSNPSTPPLPSPPQPPPRRHKSIVGVSATCKRAEEAEDVWRGAQWEAAWPRRPKPVVVAAEETDGTGAASSPSGVGRARSLSDEDLEELKACADLGFGFSYDEIPELRRTLPALELCYSMTMRQRFLDQQPQAPQEQDETAATPTSTTTIANWKISSPGDSAEEVKARLKYWAQAVACTVRLCT